MKITFPLLFTAKTATCRHPSIIANIISPLPIKRATDKPTDRRDGACNVCLLVDARQSIICIKQKEESLGITYFPMTTPRHPTHRPPRKPTSSINRRILLATTMSAMPFTSAQHLAWLSFRNGLVRRRHGVMSLSEAFAFTTTSFPTKNRSGCQAGHAQNPKGRIRHSPNIFAISYHGRCKSIPACVTSDAYEHEHSAIDDWKSHVIETVCLPSISVPSHHVHDLLSRKDSPIKDYLATRMEVLEGVHPRVKVVVDLEEHCEQQPRKRILLMSQHDQNQDIHAKASPTQNVHDIFNELAQSLPHIPQSNLQTLIATYDARPAPPQSITIPYQNQSASRILSKLLPPSALPPPSSYEQIGHVAHLNLRSNHLPYKQLIGHVLLERNNSIKTVVTKLGEVSGPYRTYQMDLLAGQNDYNVHVVEDGISLYFDLRKVYWCTRLEGERTYMIQHIFGRDEVIADAFCGVGALCLRAAVRKGCRVLANDLNPDAVAYCIDSARRNGIEVRNDNGDTNDDMFRVQCGDAREFIMNLGSSSVKNLPNHLILNFPLDSPSFLNALRWWPSGEPIANPTRVHVYTFARGDDDRTAAEVAVDMVADGLLPEGGYTESSKFRGEYLNSMGCEVEAREIRDAAPGKLVICVSFNVTRVLLRRMQGDYALI